MGVGLETWRAVGASVAGTGHRARGLGCEDACAVSVSDDGGSVLIAVADGAGSAPRSSEGSTRAVAAAMDALRAGADLCAVMHAARRSLEPVCEDDRMRDLATTLLAVRASPSGIETAQVGDGAVVVRRGGELSVVAPDDKGEYLNETVFLTSDGWLDSLRIETVPADGVDAVAVLTDGLQLVALDLATGVPHGPFFAPFFSFVAEDGDVGQLEAFLGSDRVGERTDDDVTLVVAALVGEGRRRERQSAAGT